MWTIFRVERSGRLTVVLASGRSMVQLSVISGQLSVPHHSNQQVTDRFIRCVKGSVIQWFDGPIVR
jgi:hypothetical protein